MGKRKSAAAWREFLRALRQSGNARLAAHRAGMDVGTAYDRRIRDAKFAARMDEAAAAGKALAAKAKRPLHRRSGGSPPRPGEELVARTTKHGTQLVRAARGRWSDEVWKAFRAEHRRTGNVRAAARACGLSTTALYKRRANDAEVAAAWAEDEAAALDRIPALLAAATIAALDPEVEDEDLPPVDVDQAIAIARLKCGPGARGAGARGGGRNIPPPPSIEEVRDEVVERIAAIRRHRERGQEAAANDNPPAGAGDALGPQEPGVPDGRGAGEVG